MKKTWIIVIAVVAVLVIYCVSSYNSLVTQEETVPDTGRPCQRKTHIAVLAARCSYNKRCMVVGFTHFRSQPQTSDCLLFLIHCAP